METRYKYLFISLAVVWFLIMNYLLYRIECPNCYVPVTYQGKVFGMPILGLCKNNCAYCGTDLNKI